MTTIARSLSTRPRSLTRRLLLLTLPGLMAVGCMAPEENAEADIAAEELETTEQGLTIDAEAYTGKNKRNPVSVSRQALTMAGSAGAEEVTLFSQSEADTFGNERFGAGYQARLSGTAKRQNLLANTRFEGYANTWGKVFTKSFGVATVTAVANTLNEPGKQWAGIWYSVYVFGRKVKEDTAGGGAYNREKNLFDQTQPVSPEVKTTFTVGPVPVTVSAQIFAREYLSMRGTFWVDGFDGSLKPGASVYVTAKAGVGVTHAQVGVRGNLTLLDASLPIAAKLKWGFGIPANGQCTATLSGSCSAKLTLRELNGTLDVFYELGFLKNGRRIAQWNAFQQDWELFNVARDWHLALGNCGSVIPPVPQQS